MLSIDNLKIDLTEKIFQPAKFSILTFYKINLSIMLSLDNLKIDLTEKVFQPGKSSILRLTFYGNKPENFQSNVVHTS